jgi:alpha-glucosidase
MTAPSPWWADAVVYQVYVRSFADSDGDGVGDLDGVRERLDHLVALGVDGLWLNPCYPSPQVDHGYDVADYTDIEPAYGSLDSFDALLAQAHRLGLRLLLDLVPNHCSSQHPWFLAALAAEPGSPERDRFLFRDGRGPAGAEPPNNWRSVFGGPAWTRVSDSEGSPGQWYLHLFDAQQPDFNWRSSDVGDLFESILRFWFDRGIDGFRIDVAHGLVKDPELPDVDPEQAGAHSPMWNHPDVHEVYRRWRRIADSYPGRDLTLVGEIWLPDVQDLALYLRPDELPQAFYFDLLTQPWRAPALRAAIGSGLTHIAKVGAAVTWTLSNHDVHRTVTRYGQDQSVVVGSSQDPAAGTRARGPVDLVQGKRYARSAIMMLLALPGSVYLYQGEELGLPEVMDLPLAARQDPIVRRSDGADLGRDGCRVPIPWEHDQPSFGFSLTDAPAPPWLPQPDWFGGYAVDVEMTDAGSFLSLYRRALELRREHFCEPAADLEWIELPGSPDALAFRRGARVCLVNCGDSPFALPQEWGHVVLASAAMDGRTAPAASAVWLSTVEDLGRSGSTWR